MASEFFLDLLMVSYLNLVGFNEFRLLISLTLETSTDRIDILLHCFACGCSFLWAGFEELEPWPEWMMFHVTSRVPSSPRRSGNVNTSMYIPRVESKRSPGVLRSERKTTDCFQ